MVEQTAACSVIISSPHVLEATWLAKVVQGAGCTVQCPSRLEDLPEALSTTQADVVVLDACFCGDNMATVRDLVQHQRRVVVLIDHDRPGSFVHQSFLAGANGCLLCDEQADRFAEAVKLAAQGMVVISDGAARKLTALSGPLEDHGESHPLTDLEQRVSSMVARGNTNREIGEALFISEHTVKAHLGRIMEKLGLRNRHQLAAHVAARGTGERPE